MQFTDGICNGCAARVIDEPNRLPLVPALSGAGRRRGVRMRRPPLTARATVIVANGVERVDIQTP